MFQVLNGDMISSMAEERNFGPGPVCTGGNLPLSAGWFHSNGPRPNCPQLTWQWHAMARYANQRNLGKSELEILISPDAE